MKASADMMVWKRGIILMIAPVLILTFSLALAQPQIALEKYYSDYLDKKIALCEHKAKLATSRGKNCSVQGEKALNQLRFYQNQKQQLVQEMLNQNLGTSNYKLNRFLVQTYNASETTILGAER